ncbi:MAG: 3-hydroxyacyl-CoA dehydrogenase family protein [Deltaproteobacteria bacterium]|nr:3-hydroxyacyl-CoA dehydrogenase family protein [Deltaproteobacteria bacterium]
MGERGLVVVGAGVMGHGIAQVAAVAGYPTTLVDLDEAALSRAERAIAASLAKGVERGKLSAETMQAAQARLTMSAALGEAAADADIVIEAVPEDMALKRRIFQTLEAAAPEDAVLGSNTSSLSVTELAGTLERPERVIGMHFFNPPPIVTLLEIVRAVQTSDRTLERTREMARRMGREVIVVGDSPGFATSRLGLALGLEAIRMVEQGVGSPEDIDRAMELGYRHPMGPLRLTDLVGLDTRLRIAEHLHRELGGEQFRPPVLLRQMVRAGRLGKKSGRGFYEW